MKKSKNIFGHLKKTSHFCTPFRREGLLDGGIAMLSDILDVLPVVSLAEWQKSTLNTAQSKNKSLYLRERKQNKQDTP